MLHYPLMIAAPDQVVAERLLTKVDVMKFKVLALSAVLGLLGSVAVSAADVEATILAKGTSSWDGGNFQYPSGKAELSVQKISVKAGPEPLILAMHCHTVPLGAYVLSGSVKVVKEDGREILFQKGDGLIEVVNTWHQGVFTEDSELIVFYAGAEGVALSIKKDSEQESVSGCR
ncbi:MAG: cupin domain-containing protein [Motiliproteus sp.]|nr:cupin domain-containing protein [Motiliproteus sp.]MCW9052116.1 cupin domain-containing protein [Motiliproteus sp.]